MVNGQTEIGQELLIESLSLYEQIYGILHPEVARHYLSLASIYYSLEDKTMASDLARKAVIIAERTLGLDAAETILAYLNLGLFEHALGKSSLALRYVLHAMDLTKIVYGPNHPDSITTVNNGAVILQFMKRYHESRIWFEASLAISEQVSGKASANSATLLFQLAQALALDQDTRAAVNRMRESFSLFQKLLGPEDRNTIEAEKWVNQLTHSAVTQAKRERVLASVPLRRVHFPGRRPMPNFDQSTAEASGAVRTSQQNGGVDSRDIDDLIKFIDGEDAKKKKAAAHLSNGSSNGGKKRGNPKRRGGPVVNSANGGDP
jgi:protein TIF31